MNNHSGIEAHWRKKELKQMASKQAFLVLVLGGAAAKA